MKKIFPILLVFFLSASIISCSHDKNRLTVLFERVDNIGTGSLVYLKGVPVGEVLQADIFENKVAVDIKLRNKIKIPVGSKFLLHPSLLGPSNISIDPSGETIFLTAKDTINGEFVKAGILDKFISDSAKNEKIKHSLDKIGDGIKELVESVKDTGNKKGANK